MSTKLPETKFQYVRIIPSQEGTEACTFPVETSFSEFKGPIVITGAPAAFSPTCSISHIPGYVEKLDELVKAGASQVFVVTADNPFANNAWAKKLGVKDTDKIKFITDSGAKFSQSLGYALPIGDGVYWASRYLVIAKDGEIIYKAVEEKPASEVTVSSVDNALDQLRKL
ncbi:peroxiredoxin type-2 [Kluyveromyces marxianus]|uniref:Peroxiredoxin type-2 n=2 Tax=Kluyveromyces marxianus TaxID=4911 RepID=W0T992_KLUMD|nr:peroxiredoxin type-2 [Kluyveromyces marxianus DMKU3-1042]QGN15936.1 peroxiredoxin type-2 [Kluyveromyces marxianus]BAO40197.1 peroxiredoxin type-2 [Kluyveromyces marxianus DMKU3-1042]BAP71693.1 peroxiredoxin type-2 [Kluyveromyces marxianus]